MVHDLTASGDFQKDRHWLLELFAEPLTRLISSDRELQYTGGFKSELTRFLFHDKTLSIDELTPATEEVVLTGTTSDREMKQYQLDSVGDKQLCDRCGGIIIKTPWNMDSPKTLCHRCEKDMDDYLDIDHVKLPQIEKPWDMNDSERENYTDNIFLWD